MALADLGVGVEVDHFERQVGGVCRDPAVAVRGAQVEAHRMLKLVGEWLTFIEAPLGMATTGLVERMAKVGTRGMTKKSITPSDSRTKKAMNTATRGESQPQRWSSPETHIWHRRLRCVRFLRRLEERLMSRSSSLVYSLPSAGTVISSIPVVESAFRGPVPLFVLVL